MPAREDKVDTWMPWYVRDFLAATEGLTAVEGWAYTRLLSHMWLEHGYLSDDPRVLAKLARVRRTNWPRVWQTLATFFEVVDGGRITQKRLLFELSEAREKRHKRRESGRTAALKRWADEREKHAAEQDAIAVRSQYSSPSPSPSPSPSSTPAEGEGETRARARSTALRQLLDAFCAAWRRRYRVDYAVTDRDRAFLGRVLKDLTPEQTSALPACFSAYTRDEDPFLVEKQRHSLWFFCKQGGQNKYRISAPIRSEKEARTATAVERFINGGNDGRQNG